MDKPKSFIDQIRDVDAKERQAEENQNQAEREKMLQKEKIAQDEYNKRLQLERVELMRLKQGVITEPELIVREEKEKKIYTTKEKISNFFYHNKLYIILVSCLAVIAFFLIRDIVTNVRPDANVLIISANNELSLKTNEAEALFEKYATDKNGDGKVSVSVLYIPVDDTFVDNAQVYQANMTKLIGEIQTNDSVIVIGDDATLTKIDLKQYLVNLKERYPENKNVSEQGILLEDTDFAKELGITTIDAGTVLCVQEIYPSAKEKVKKNHEFALSILDKLMADIG